MSEPASIPESVADITPEWLTPVLRGSGVISEGARVAAVRATVIGEGVGFVGTIARLDLAYDGDAGDAPPTLIAKLHSTDPASRALGAMYGLYEREVRFYNELAGKVALHSPRCYAAMFDPASARCTLLLEDLGPTGRLGDQLATPSAADMELAMRELARFHAGAWQRAPIEEHPWLVSGLGLVRTVLATMYPAMYPVFLERYGDTLPQEIRDAIPSLNTECLALLDEAERGPRTLAHGDYRLDNMCFGQPGSHYALSVIDWQSVTAAPAYFDVAYFISTSLPVETRRASQDELLRIYEDELRRNGVREVTAAGILDEMRRGMLPMFAIGVVNGATLQPELNERGVQLFEAIFERFLAAVDDLGALQGR